MLRNWTRPIGFLAIGAAALIASVGRAQPAPSHASPTTSPEYVQQAWTVRDGLPVNSVNRAVQSRDGYLWLATWDGLVRFDGARFTVFNTGNTDALPSNRIADLVTTRDGTFWARTEQAHLVRMRGSTFTHIAEAQGLRDGITRILYPDPDGRLWVGTDDGVWVVDGERAHHVAERDIRGPVDAVQRARDGALWVGTRANGLYRVAGDSVRHVDAPPGITSVWITALLEDRARTVWVGTSAGMFRVHDGVAQRIVGASGGPFTPQVLEMREAPSGDVWVFTERGLYVARPAATGDLHLRPVAETPNEASLPNVNFDAAGRVWYSVGTRLYRDGQLVFELPLGTGTQQSAGAHIQRFTWDREGSLWIATYNSGLFQLKPSLFRVYSDAEGLAYRNVAAVLEDRTGVMWIGTLGRGVGRLEHDRITNFPFDPNAPRLVNSMMQDRDGHLWVGFYALGIRYCTLPAMTCGAPPAGQLADGVTPRAMLQDATGAVWVGTDHGLFRTRGAAWERMAERELPAPGVVRVLLEAHDGTLWMGTNGNGLLAYRGGRFTLITSADGLPSDIVRSLYEDANGRLWVGTEGRGLVRLTISPDAQRVAVTAMRNVRQRDGLFDEVIHAILADDAGRLWMSTNRGIFWVTLAELDAFAEGKLSRIHSTSYTERDGLRNREGNGGNFRSAIRAHDGRMWFATQDGVAVVDPAHVQRNLVPPPVLVERVVARGRTVPKESGAATIEPDARTFEIDYTAPSFVAPENVRFRYRLEGLDPEWIEAGNRRTAFFTNVPPGHYTFRVVASNNDGVWNETGTSLAVHVTPRFAETRLATLLFVLGLGLAGAGMFQWRVRRLRGRERELTHLVATRTAQLEAQNEQLASQAEKLAELDEAKSRLFANVSHEFRTPLTLIMGPLRGLLDGRHGALTASARAQGELMLRNSQRLLRLINQILDLAKLQAGEMTLHRQPLDLVGFVRNETMAFAPLAERRGIALRFRASVDELTAAFDAEQLEKVLLNLLSNALKFTDAGGNVDVSIRRDGDDVLLSVADSGVGIAPSALSRVFERFHQGDASVTRRFEGTGIGLALARELVELHGGTITAESALGVGSTFIVRLPLGVSVTVDQGSGSTARGSGPSREEHLETNLVDEPTPEPDAEEDRTTVLVVDDNPDVRAYVRSILAPTYRVLEASNGRAGLEHARSALPDLVVADVMMPELDGLELARALKGDAMTDAIPVILLTARATPQDHVTGLETGADTYLTKPFDPDVLEAAVANLLAQRRRLRVRFAGAATGSEPVAVPPRAIEPAPALSAIETQLRSLVVARLTDPSLNAESLATAAGMSYHQVYRALRDEAGVSPTRFVRGVRAECAAELLRNGEGSITEIAYAVGFQSLSYFNRAFRERFGTSPSEYADGSGSRQR